MTIQSKTVHYLVRDLNRAKAMLESLFGAQPHVELPYYVDFSVNGFEIGLVPNDHSQAMNGPEPYFDVVDITATLAALHAAGAEIPQEPNDVGSGVLVA